MPHALSRAVLPPLLYRTAACLALAAMAAVMTAGRAASPPKLVAGCGYVPPLLYWTPEKGPAGFAFEVLNEAARREGIRIEWRKTGNTTDIERDLEQGRFDIMPAGIDTAERRARFFVSRPWWESDLAVLARHSSGVTGPSTLRGKRLALASPGYRHLAARYFPGAVMVVPDVPRGGAPAAAAAVCSGAADAALIVDMAVHDLLANPPDGCHGVPLNTFDTQAAIALCIVGRRSSRSLATRLRDRIDELTADGTLAAIAARNPPVPTRSAVVLAEVLRDRYDRRVLLVALFSSLAVLALGSLFLVRQNRTRKVLEGSEARYQSLFELAAAGVVHLDAASGRFLAANQEFCKISGYSRQELLAGLTFSYLSDPQDLEESLAWYQRLVMGGVPSYSIEKRCLRKDGERFWARLDVAGVHSGGQVLYVVAVVQDITERKKAEADLRESEERLRLAIDSTGLGAFDFNPQTRAMVWSAKARQQFGLPEEAAIDYDAFVGGIHPDDRERVVQSIEAALRPESDGRYRAEYRVIGVDDGRVRWLSAVGRAFFDAQGRAMRFIGVQLDISDRRQAENALRESERHFHELADSMPQLVWMAEPGGRVTYYNRQWNRQLGLAEDEVPGETWSALVDPEDRERFESAWRRSLETGAECEVECRLRAADGSYRWFLARAVPVRDTQGGVARWFGTCTDVHDSKQAEERLRQAQKLESVGTLAGGIAHDFNNLLTGIMGNASLAIPEVGPETASKLANVVIAAEHGAHLTRQLLAYSGKGRFYVKDIDLSAAVREMEDLLRVSVPRTAELRLELAGNLPPVRMDPSQFQQVVMSLTMNAGEAIGEDAAGVISVSTGAGAIERPFTDALGREAAPGRYTWIEVADNGPGIDAETRSWIFDPFFTTKFTGRGLGLAAVSGIVRTQNGALELETAPGRGSRFRVHFPVAEAASRRPCGSIPEAGAAS